MQEAKLVLHLWLRLAWVDTRLSWDPSLYGGIESIAFVASPVAIEESQIWVPEVELYSGVSSTYELPRKEVLVSHNGSAFWSRPGKLSSVCQLDGLQDFPFDTITCPMRFGGWSLGGSVQNLSLFELGALDATMASMATFQEMRVASTTVRRGVDDFSCCPDPEGWPYVEYVLAFQRAEKHYDMKLIMMNVVLTYLSCGVFLLDPRTGERLQFSTTILLTVVAADSLVTGVVPVCVPVLWIEYFFLLCWTCCVLSIIGNMMTHWLFYKSPPEVYASGMPRARAFHLWLERHLHRRPRRPASQPPAAMWRLESVPDATSRSCMLNPTDHLSPQGPSPQSSMGSLFRHGSAESVGSHTSLPMGLQRGRSSCKITHAIRRVPTNPFLEPNRPGPHTIRRQKSGWARPLVVPPPHLQQQQQQQQHSHHHAVEHMPSLEEASVKPSPRNDGATSEPAAAGSEPRRLAPAGVRFADASVVSRGPEKAEGGGGDDAPAGTPEKSAPAEEDAGSSNGARRSDGKSKLKHITRQVIGDIEVKKGMRKYPRISRIASVLVRAKPDDEKSHRKRVAPFEGAFVGAEELAHQVTATELDPVQAALVRKAFRLLDSMSTSLGVIGPEQMQYFANHMGQLPKTEASEAKRASGDELWQIEEFSELCLALIKREGHDKFRILVEGLLESYEYKAKLHKIYWEGWALWLDYVCFCTLTFSFTVALLVLSRSMRNIGEPDDAQHTF